MAKHIDTLDVQLSLRGRVKELIKSKLYPSSTEIGIYKSSPEHLPVAFYYRCRGYYLIIKISHQFMVGVETAEELEKKVIQLVTDFFNITTDDIVKYKVVKTPKTTIRVRCNSEKYITGEVGGNKILHDLVEINRCEYKNDYRLKADDEKIAIMDIFRIISDTVRGADKGQYKYSNRTNCIYKSNRNNHVSITCYFKEYERLETGDLEGAEKYKGLIRSEVKLKNAHLNYKRRTMDKTLANYFKDEVAQKYFQKYLEPIFYTEDFHRLDIALEKIRNYKPENEEDLVLKDYEKERLSSFITDINRDGITAVRSKHDGDTFKKYIKKIRQLGINPLCFSPVINGTVIETKIIKNFTLFENSISEDI